MADLSPGVVLISEFDYPSEASEERKFSDYLDYLNREAAKQDKDGNIITYEQYTDYMGDPEKTTGLFSSVKDILLEDDIKDMKEKFDKAEDNGSVLWKTIISFDNEWLQENGVYDPETKFLNTSIVRDSTRNCMKKILEKEGLDQSAVWSAAIHYNTDNIHVHISTVEPVPMREKKSIKIIEFERQWLKDHGINTEEKKNDFYVDGNEKYVNRNEAKVIRNSLKNIVWTQMGENPQFGDLIELTSEGNIRVSFTGDIEKIPPMANLVVNKSEYKGTWKMTSIKAGKSRVVNTIVGRQPENDLINSIIRDHVVHGIRNQSSELMMRDDEVKDMFLNLYYSMPKDRRQWNYASNTFGKENRTRLDKLTERILEKYFDQDMKELDALLEKQGDNIVHAYGGGTAKAQFMENKKADLYKRAGNAILKEMKIFDKLMKKKNSIRSDMKKHPTRNPRRISDHLPTNSGRDHLERELSAAMRQINRSLNKTIENYKNLQTYQRIQQEIDYDI